jgi:hypothetical protein
MRVQIDGSDKLHIQFGEATRAGTLAFSGFFLVLAVVAIVISLALKVNPLLVFMNPVIILCLFIAALPLLSSDQFCLDRHARSVVRVRRWLHKTKTQRWDFEVFSGVLVREGRQDIARIGEVPAFRLYLRFGEDEAEKSHIELEKADSQEDADRIAKLISDYTGWPVYHEKEATRNYESA